MNEIIPAIIPESFEEMEKKMGEVKGLVNKVQVDFVDGKYSPNTSWPFNSTEDFYKNKKEFKYKDELIIEADLLIFEPENYIDIFLKMGVRSFVVHLDSTDYLDKCIFMAKNMGASVGVGLKPSTELHLAEEFLHRIDFVQFMGNDRVGYNGVQLDRRVLDKIHHFHSAFPFVEIQVDIGVNENTLVELKKVGVSGFVSGSAVFNGEGKIEENIKKLKNI